MPNTKRNKYDEALDTLQCVIDELADMIKRHNRQDPETGVWDYDYGGVAEAQKVLGDLRSAFPPPAEDARQCAKKVLQVYGLTTYGHFDEDDYQEVALQKAAAEISRFAESRVDDFDTDIYTEVYSLLAGMKPNFEEVEAVRGELFRRYDIQRKRAARPSSPQGVNHGNICYRCKRKTDDIDNYTISNHKGSTFWSVDLCLACRDGLLATIEPSPQGDDAGLKEAVELIRAFIDETQVEGAQENHKQRALGRLIAIEDYANKLRSRLASAQSSAQGEEARGPWHFVDDPDTEGLYLVELKCKEPPNPWHETAYWKSGGWTLPNVGHDGAQIVAWMPIPARAALERTTKE